MFYRFACAVTKILRIFFFPLKVYGKENIPAKGSFILASNHQSYLDPVVIPISCPRRLSFLARESLFENKWLGLYLRNVGAFPIKRKSSDIKAIKEIFKRLESGIPVLIFPEGSRHKEERENRVEAGVGLIAVKSGVPVIPVCVSGSDKALPPGAKKINRALVTVMFGKPLVFSKADSYQNVAHKIMDEIFAMFT